MDSALEKNANEIESLERQIKSNKKNLDEYHQELREKQTLLKELHKEHHELGMKMQKIIEKCEKLNEGIKQQTNYVQNAQQNNSSLEQRLISKQNEYKEKKALYEEEQKEHTRFLQTVAGSLYTKFLLKYPHFKNTNRWTCEEWGNYCLKTAASFEGEFYTYRQNQLDYPNHVAVQKTVDEYNTEARKNGRWSLAKLMEFIKEKHNDESSKHWYRTNQIKNIQVPEFPKFVFQPPCTPHIREARISQSEKYYETCSNWVETNKQAILNLNKNLEKAAEQKIETEKEQKRLGEEGVRNTEIFKEYILTKLLDKLGNTLNKDEAEAILGKYYEPQLKTPKIDICHPYLWKNVFKQDSLLAMKVCNRFAQQNEIRVEDAMALFKEYAAIQYTLPNENKNTNTRSYIRDVNC